MKTLLLCLFLLGAVILFWVSCKSSKKVLTETEIKALPLILEYSKSACFGRCPHFNLTVHKNGWMLFEGKRFTAYEGRTTDRLSKEELAQLIADCKNTNLFQYEAEYGMNIPDLPTTKIHYHEDNQDKAVRWKLRPPQELKDLDKKIFKIVTDRGWVTNGHKNTGRGQSVKPSTAIENELIVQFDKDVDIQAILNGYKAFDLKLKKTISKNSDMYLLEYDTEKIPPHKMMRKMKAQEGVLQVEFNKGGTIRTR